MGASAGASTLFKARKFFCGIGANTSRRVLGDSKRKNSAIIFRKFVRLNVFVHTSRTKIIANNVNGFLIFDTSKYFAVRKNVIANTCKTLMIIG